MSETFYVKEGHEEQFSQAMLLARSYFKDGPPKSFMLKVIMNTGLDRHLGLGCKRKRIRKKRLKQLMKEVDGDMIRNVFKHFIGFDEEGYRIEGASLERSVE